MSHSLIVTAVEAKNLLAADRGGTSDPYCKLRVGSQNFKTKIVKKCLAPKWNETFTFKVADPRSATLIIEVLDHDTFSADDPLGSISIPLNKLERGVETTTWHNLSGVPKGQINIRLKAIDFGVEPGSNTGAGPVMGGPVGYQSQSQPPMGGGYPSQGGFPPNPQQPPMGGGYPPNPYASQQPPMGGGYPPNPYGPPQGGGYPPNPYGPPMGGGYPPDPYNSMGGGYPPNPYGPPMPMGAPQAGPYGSQLPPQQPGAYPPQQGAPYGSQLPPQQPGGFPPQQPPGQNAAPGPYGSQLPPNAFPPV